MDRPPVDKPLSLRADLLDPLVSLHWERCNDLPVGINWAHSVWLNNKLYVGGGNILSGSDAQLLVYTPSEDSWELIPTPTQYYALATYHSQAVLVGGEDPTTEEPTNKVWLLEGRSCEPHPTIPDMPVSTAIPCAVSSGDYLLVAGDEDGEESTPVSVFDGQKWCSAQALPEQLDDLHSAVNGNEWFLSGEKKVYRASLKSLIASAVNPAAAQPAVWESLPNTPHQYSGLTWCGGHLLAVGGQDSHYVNMRSVYAYDTQAKVWEHVSDLPGDGCRDSSCAVLPTGELLVAGGVGAEQRVLKATIRVSTLPGDFITIKALKTLESKGRVFIFRQIARHSEAFIKETSISLPGKRKPPGKKLLETWLQQSQPPPTWETLFSVLRNIGLSKTVKKVEEFFNSLSKTYAREADEAAAREEAAKEGFVRIRSRNILITGAGGAGKTSSMCVMFEENPPNKYTSTGVCETAKRAVLVRDVEHANRVVCIGKKKRWVGGNKLLPLVADWAIASLKEKREKSDQENVKASHSKSLASNNTELSDTSRTSQSNSKHEPKAEFSNKSSSSVQVLDVNYSQSSASNSADVDMEDGTNTSETLNTLPPSVEGHSQPSGSSAAESIAPVSADSGEPTAVLPLAQRVLSDVTELMKDSSNPLGSLNVDILHIIDSGGQLQFHEIVKKFLPNIDAVVFVTDITKDPKSKVVDLFFVDGEPVGEPYESQYTHEQLFKRSLQALQIQHQKSNLAILATHIDLVKDQPLEAKIAEKNDWFCKTMENCKQLNARIIKNGDSAADVVFALQAAPSASSKEIPSDSVKVAQRLLERLNDDQCVPAVETKIPLRRFLFEQTMREAGKDSRGVVSMAKCREIARSFQIESVNDVLQYLSNRNLILYAPEVIPDLVFCDVQTPLNVIKQLAQYCSKVRADAEVKDVPRADLNPRNLEFLATHGTLTEKLLHSKEFKNQFDDIFTPGKLLKLLEHLIIIADQSLHVYFMPCILREMPEDCLKHHRMPSNGDVEPLLLYFSEWPLASVFCTLIARLVSLYGWKPVPFRGEKHLYRNCIKLSEDSNRHCSVTLIESYDSGYFEVHLTLAQGEPHECLKTLCPTIRGMLLEALPSELDVKDAFLCPIEACNQPNLHAAVLDKKHLKCTAQEEAMRLPDTDKRYVWFGTSAEGSETSQLSCPAPIFGKEPEAGDIVSFKWMDSGTEQTFKLREAFSSTWRDLGRKFGFSGEKLHTFATNNRDNPEQCFDDVISHWMSDGSNASEAYPVTWGSLVQALEDVGGVNVKVDKLKMALKKKKALLGKHKHPEYSQSPSSTAATSSLPFTQASSPKRSRAEEGSTDAAAASTTSLQPPHLTQQTTVSLRPPVISPWQPAVSPRQPVVSPRPPAVSPRQPVVSPRQPTVSPRPPAISPRQPAVSPRQPVVSPRPPAVSPRPPAVSPRQPAISPRQPAVSPRQPVVSPRQPVSLHPAFSLPQPASLENVSAVPLTPQHVIPPAPTLQAASHHPHPAGYTTYPVCPSGPTQYMPHPLMPPMAPSYPHPSPHYYHHSGGHPWPPPPAANYHDGPSGVSPSPYYPATHFMAPSPQNYGPHYSNNPSNAQHSYFPSGSGALNPNPQAGQDQPPPFPSSSQYPGSWPPHQ